MCGIAGFVHFHGHDPDRMRPRIRRMTDTLFHRGPDDHGFHLDHSVAFGHRRLSIIDIDGGRQPMHTQDGTLSIVFNGEIYNFLEIRTELEKRGVRFQTRSDTEVILYAYRQWGSAMVGRLNGMFAFAIWDAGRRRLFLARDRVGKKPLYWYRAKDAVAFASELKALMAGGFCPPEIEPTSLDDYYCLGYIPAPRTLFKKVHKLRAAHHMTIDAESSAPKRYWQVSFARPRPLTAEAALARFEALLTEAVRCRLMSEVPLGAFLSGGLDSSLVVAAMSACLDRPVLTNSIGFKEQRYSELPLAQSVADHLGSDHHQYIVQPMDAAVLTKIAWHFDEPLADCSALPTWFVCQMARENVTVALSGDGGDEVFGGYTFRYLPHMVETRVRGALPAWLRGPLCGGLGAWYPASARLPKYLRLKTILQNLSVSDGEAFYRDLTWLRPGVRRRLYRSDFYGALKGYTPLESVWPLYANSDAPDPIGRSQQTDIAFYMSNDVLVKVDRMSMAHSLEVRSPFLDHRLIEFAARLPLALKCRGRRGKLMLRRSAAAKLPPGLLAQPKRGFDVPKADWLRKPLKSFAHDLIFASRIIDDTLDQTQLARLWAEHMSTARDHSGLIWALMMLALWENHYR